MVVRNKQEFLNGIAEILNIPVENIDVERTTIPPEKISEVVNLLSGKVLIFRISARLNTKKLPQGVAPTIRQLYNAIDKKRTILDH